MKNCLKFTTLLLFVAFFGACTKDKEEKGSIPSDHYVLSPDGKTLLKWTNPSTVEVDFQADEQLSKVTKIAEGAFAESVRLERINLFNVTSIGGDAFAGCISLSSIQIPAGVTSIEEGTFAGCISLSSIQIPNGVTSIKKYAFSGCTSLSSVQIPNGVTSIGNFAFYDCTSLIRFVIKAGTPPKCYGLIFGNSPNVNLNIYVPNGSVEIYKTSPVWRFYKEKIKSI